MDLRIIRGVSEACDQAVNKVFCLPSLGNIESELSIFPRSVDSRLATAREQTSATTKKYSKYICSNY